MADPVRNALRRKLAAAEAVGDVARIKIIRGLMAKPAEEPAEAPIEVPAEAQPEVPAIEEERVEEVPTRRSWWLERDE